MARLFVAENYKWDSLDEMNGCDGGYDVRVFDARFACVSAAHEEFKERWIEEEGWTFGVVALTAPLHMITYIH